MKAEAVKETVYREGFGPVAMVAAGGRYGLQVEKQEQLRFAGGGLDVEAREFTQKERSRVRGKRCLHR